MAWFMFKDSESYQYKGKKCEGFPNKANQPHINLSWGMDHLEHLYKPDGYKPYSNNYYTNSNNNNNNHNNNNNSEKNNNNEKNNIYVSNNPDKNKSSFLPGVYEKKSEQEELEKIMKSYDNKKVGNKKQIKVMQQNQYGYSSLRPVEGKVNRSDTQQSAEKIRVLENSLIPLNSPPVAFHRRDTMGSILNPDKQMIDHDMAESRVSRRSTSGNKKNQSRVVFGDGIYNSFMERSERKKNFHEQLMQMYDYEDKKKDRKISQIAL